MLKLYKKTTIISLLASFFLFLLGLYFNKYETNTASYVQNCIIGIACSLFVVAVTTIFQYLDEHKKVFYNYKRHLRKLYLQIYIFEKQDLDNLPYEYLKKNEEDMEYFLDEVKKCVVDLCWINPKTQKGYLKDFLQFNNIYVAFYEHLNKELFGGLKKFVKDKNIRIKILDCLKQSADSEADKMFLENFVRE